MNAARLSCLHDREQRRADEDPHLPVLELLVGDAGGALPHLGEQHRVPETAEHESRGGGREHGPGVDDDVHKAPSGRGRACRAQSRRAQLIGAWTKSHPVKGEERRIVGAEAAAVLEICARRHSREASELADEVGLVVVPVRCDELGPASAANRRPGARREIGGAGRPLRTVSASRRMPPGRSRRSASTRAPNARPEWRSGCPAVREAPRPP